MTHFARRRSALAVAVSLALGNVASGAPIPEPPLRPPPDLDGAPAGAPEAARKIFAAARNGDRSWRRLAELCDLFGPRPAGGQNYARAAEWALGEMKKDGLVNVRTEAVPINGWRRGEESLVLLEPNGPRPLPAIGLGKSVGTPPEGITAPLVVVRDFDELDQRSEKVRGKIVVYNHPMRERPERSPDYGDAVAYRWSGASRAAKHGAVAVLVRSVTTARWRSLHTGAMGYDEKLPRIPAAAITIEDAEMLQRLADRGTPLAARLTMGARFVPDATDVNIVGEIVGRERPDEIVLIGGHFDSWDLSCGAHDDASGAVIALEAVRLLNELGLRPRRTVRVVLFANEEHGVEGGDGYLESHRDEIDHYHAALEADGGAFAPRGFGFEGAPEAASQLDALMALFRPLGDLTLRRGWSGADISPMVKLGVPGLGLSTNSVRYFDFHHSAADTPDKVEPRDMNDCVAAFTLMTWLLAESPEPLPRRAPPSGE